MKSRTNLQIRHLSLCIDQACILWPLGKALLAKLGVWLGVCGGDVINDVADASSGKDDNYAFKMIILVIIMIIRNVLEIVYEEKETRLGPVLTYQSGDCILAHTLYIHDQFDHDDDHGDHHDGQDDSHNYDHDDEGEADHEFDDDQDVHHKEANPQFMILMIRVEMKAVQDVLLLIYFLIRLKTYVCNMVLN